MANQWFRLYAEFATDPKVQMMSEAMQRRFIMLLCLRCGNDHVTLQDEEIAFQLRISNEEWAETRRVFLAKNLIDEDGRPTNWDKRQFASDSSAERVKKHREKKKLQRNVTVTPPDTDTDTDTDTDSETEEEESSLRSDSCSQRSEIADELEDETLTTTPDEARKSTGSPESASPVVIALPLNDSTEYPITEAMVAEWSALYPAVDVMQALRSMKGWCLSNPQKRKTRSGILRFANSWLSKAQNRGGEGIPPNDHEPRPPSHRELIPKRRGVVA